MLSAHLFDHEHLLAVVEIEHVLEVGRKQVRHARLRAKTLREALDAIVYLPLDLLAVICRILLVEHNQVIFGD